MGAMGAMQIPPPSGGGGGQLFQGVIRMYDDSKGYGFIECDESKLIYNKDIFLLRSAMKGNATNGKEGDRVSFSVNVGNKGPVAENVTILQGGSPDDVQG